MKLSVRVFPLFAVFVLFILPLSSQEAEQEEVYERYVFSESEAAFKQHQSSRTRFIPGVSSFGSGGVAYYTLASMSPLNWQFGTGMFIFSDVPDRNYAGTLVDERALALPLYTGVRYDLYRSTEATLDYAIFSSLVGGPVIGMGIPDRSGFANSISAAQFRWGAGGQASLGIEMFFSERWAGYIQAGVDAVGFTRPLGGEKGYLGPAFGLGFGRILGR